MTHRRAVHQVFSLSPPKTFRAWQIEITTRCGLACQKCIRRGVSGWDNLDMSLESFGRLVPYFRDVQMIVLQGWGEPLMHPDLAPIIRLAKTGGPQVGFVTSGTGLTPDRSAELHCAGIDFIGFSYAGATAKIHESVRRGSDFSKLNESVASFVHQGKQRASGPPRAHLVYMLLKDTLRDVPLLPRLARDLGVEEIVLTNLIHVTDDWQDEQKVFACVDRPEIVEETERTLAEAREEAGRLGIRLRVPSLLPRPVPVCEENPLATLYITANGEVSPCVYLHPPVGGEFARLFCGTRQMMRPVGFGNVFEMPFDRIWTAEAYRGFREVFSLRSGWKQKRPSLLRQMFRPSGTGVETAPPDPPGPCRTCHKMLGF